LFLARFFLKSVADGDAAHIHTVLSSLGIQLKVIVSKVVFVLDNGPPQFLKRLERDLLDVQQGDMQRRAHLSAVRSKRLSHHIQDVVEVWRLRIDVNVVWHEVGRRFLLQKGLELVLGFGEGFDVHGWLMIDKVMRPFKFFAMIFSSVWRGFP